MRLSGQFKTFFFCFFFLRKISRAQKAPKRTANDFHLLTTLCTQKNGKIVIFKTISILKIIFQVFTTTAPKHIVNELKKNKKIFF